MKEALLPCVPDPRGSFPGLFEKHGGNFQVGGARGGVAGSHAHHRDAYCRTSCFVKFVIFVIDKLPQ